MSIQMQRNIYRTVLRAMSATEDSEVMSTVLFFLSFFCLKGLQPTEI